MYRMDRQTKKIFPVMKVLPQTSREKKETLTIFLIKYNESM